MIQAVKDERSTGGMRARSPRAELWEAIRNEDWSMGAISSNNRPSWHRRLWDMTRHYHFTGPAGGGGEGYGAPATAGAALANKGRLTVTIQGDGDLMYCPGVLWTCAHSRLPVLYVMHNHRAYHQERLVLQRMANRRQRGIDRNHVGTTLRVLPPQPRSRVLRRVEARCTSGQGLRSRRRGGLLSAARDSD
jgi:thiamine pyrophosphate-dependent acetolactate synthase large subunit-like protein